MVRPGGGGGRGFTVSADPFASSSSFSIFDTLNDSSAIPCSLGEILAELREAKQPDGLTHAEARSLFDSVEGLRSIVV